MPTGEPIRNFKSASKNFHLRVNLLFKFSVTLSLKKLKKSVCFFFIYFYERNSSPTQQRTAKIGKMNNFWNVVKCIILDHCITT